MNRRTAWLFMSLLALCAWLCVDDYLAHGGSAWNVLAGVAFATVLTAWQEWRDRRKAKR